MNLIYWPVHSCSRMRGWMGCIVILASCEYHFNRVHENLEQHPSNNISKWQIYDEGFLLYNAIFLHKFSCKFCTLFPARLRSRSCILSSSIFLVLATAKLDIWLKATAAKNGSSLKIPYKPHKFHLLFLSVVCLRY